MTSKTNIPATVRNIVFTGSGNDEWSGVNLENAVSTPQAALVKVGLLSPPPAQFFPASINASATGASFGGIVMPDSVSCNAILFAIVTSDPVAQTLGSNQASELGANVTTSSNAINTLVAGKQRVTSMDSTMTVGSNGGTPTTGNIGIKVTGACDNLFFERTVINLQGEGAIGIEHTATSPTPVQYEVKSGEIFNDNQTVLKMDSPAAQQIELDMGTVRISPTASTTNSCILDIVSGAITVRASSLVAADLLRVGSDGLTNLNVSGAAGNIILDAGSGANVDANFLIGDITVGVGALLRIQCMFHLGAITNNGTIDGIINGVRYGNWIVDAVDVTSPAGAMYLKQNTVSTTFLAANTFADILGTVKPSANNNLWSFSGNTLTSLEVKNYKAVVKVNAALRRPSGGVSRDFAIILFEDAGGGFTQVTDGESNTHTNNTTSGLSFVVDIDVEEGKVFKVMAENRTTGEPVIIDYDVTIIQARRV